MKIPTMEYQGQQLVAGTNARMRALLGADIVPAPRCCWLVDRDNKPPARDKESADRTPPGASEAPSRPPAIDPRYKEPSSGGWFVGDVLGFQYDFHW